MCQCDTDTLILGSIVREKSLPQTALSLNAGQKCCRMEHSAILSTFIKPPFVIKSCFVYFKWLLKTGFTVVYFLVQSVIHFISSMSIMKDPQLSKSCMFNKKLKVLFLKLLISQEIQYHRKTFQNGRKHSN